MTEDKMNHHPGNFSRITWLLGAAACGALAMYVLDPEQGKRRRAVARDKVYSARIRTRKSIDAASRDISNRVHGVMAEASHMLPTADKQSSTPAR